MQGSLGPRSLNQFTAPGLLTGLLADDDERRLRSQMSNQYFKQGNFLSVPKASESHRSLAGKQVFIGHLNESQFKGRQAWASLLGSTVRTPSVKQVAQWAHIPLKMGSK